MSKEMLTEKKVTELVQMCKDRSIHYYHGKNRFNKKELIDALLEYESKNTEVKSESNFAKGFSENEYATNEEKMKYVSEAAVGTLVAFYDEKGKARTAAIVNRSLKRQELKVETEFGRTFVVSFDKVFWVKTGKRWPRGVYNLLKGIKNENSDKQKNDCYTSF